MKTLKDQRIEQIHSAMRKKAHSNYTLAKSAGVKYDTIVRFFNNGETNIVTLDKILNALDIKRISYK